MTSEKPSRVGLVIVILLLIIVVLFGVIAYSFWIKPSIDGYIVQKQVEAKDIVLAAILAQLQQQGYVQISDKDGKSIVLVPAQQQPTQG